MSVILDALHKARTDRRKNQEETHPNGVARVLEPGITPVAPTYANDPAGRNSRGWGLPLAIIFGAVCLMLLAGGAFYMLYDQVRRIGQPAAATVSANSTGIADGKTQAAGSAIGNLPSASVATVSPAALPTPLPLSDLPVQPPSQGTGAATNNGVYAAAGQAAVAPAVPAAPPQAKDQFKLGSIVCENNDCIAHLNGRTVRVGDQVKHYRISEITASSITLQGTTPDDVITLSQFD